MQKFQYCTLEIDGPVAILRLDHPEVMNAVSVDMLGGITDALGEIEDKKEQVRCVVLTGQGRAFCTGANLQGRNQQSGENKITRKGGAGSSLETNFHPVLRRLRNLHCPLITAVNGPAAGAGMSMALMGDLILCAKSAYFLAASASCRIAARRGCYRASSARRAPSNCRCSASGCRPKPPCNGVLSIASSTMRN